MDWEYTIRVVCDEHARPAMVGRFGRTPHMGWVDARGWGDTPPSFVAAGSGERFEPLTNSVETAVSSSGEERAALGCPRSPRCPRFELRDAGGDRLGALLGLDGRVVNETLAGVLDAIASSGRRRVSIRGLIKVCDELTRRGASG